MNAWVTRRILALRARLTTRADRERGQTSFEYLGIAVVIAVLIGVLASSTSIGDAVLNGILNQITKIVGGGK